MKRFKAYNGNSVIVCLALPEPQARLLHAVVQILNPDVELEDVEDLHITLNFLGKVEDLVDRKNDILQNVFDFSRQHQAISGEINGGGMFADKGDGKPVWAYFESQPLYDFRQRLTNHLIGGLINDERPFGIVPHITMAYLNGSGTFLLQFPSLPITFENVSVWWGGERYNFPLQSIEQKEVGSTPITSYGHGPEGLLSVPGLEEDAEKKAREKLPKGVSEEIVTAWKTAYLKKLVGQESALFVFKDTTGRHRWVSISSTAFKDKDGEIVSREALEKATYKMQSRNNYGPLRFWHMKGLDLGGCDFSIVHSRSLVESGTFVNENVGQAVAKKAPVYKMSIGFNYPIGQPDLQGVYKDIDIFERSIVPADLASNLFTGLFVSEEKIMNDTKQAAIVSAFKNLGLDEATTNALLGQVNFNEKSADNMGVGFKEQDLTKLSPLELLEYAQKAVKEYEQEQEQHKEVRLVVEKAVSEQTKTMREEMKAMMDRMNAMMARMNGGKEDDDKKEEKTKEVDETSIKLKEAETQIQTLMAQLQQTTKMVNDLATAAPRRATTADDNVIAKVKTAAENGNVTEFANGGESYKDHHDAFIGFLAGGIG